LTTLWILCAVYCGHYGHRDVPAGGLSPCLRVFFLQLCAGTESYSSDLVTGSIEYELGRYRRFFFQPYGSFVFPRHAFPMSSLPAQPSNHTFLPKNDISLHSSAPQCSRRGMGLPGHDDQQAGRPSRFGRSGQQNRDTKTRRVPQASASRRFCLTLSREGFHRRRKYRRGVLALETAGHYSFGHREVFFLADWRWEVL